MVRRAVIAALILGVSAGRGGPRLLEVVTIVFFVVNRDM